MMRYLLILLFIFVSEFSYSALTCTDLFKGHSSDKSVTTVFDGFMTTNKREKRSMYVKVQKPAGQEPSKWRFYIHGLMDSHVGWDSVVKEALEKGEGVIRVDLHGHARTLARNYESGMQLLDTRDNYQVNVIDVIQVLKILKAEFGISKPDLVGHSYGGGIAINVAIHPFGQNLISRDLTLMAPYIYRIDGYKAENAIFMMGGLPFLEVLKNMTTDKMQAQIESMTTDPVTDAFMTKAFTKHFEKLLDQRVPELSTATIRALSNPAQRVDRRRRRQYTIQQHVQAAIKITKGIRTFDGRKVVDELPADIRLNMILGENDKLVPRDMEMEFFDLLEERDLDVNLNVINGAGHMMTEEKPKDVFDSLEDLSPSN